MIRHRAPSWSTAVIVVALVGGIVALAYSPLVRGPRGAPDSPGASPTGPAEVTVTRGAIRSVVVLDGVVVRPPADGGATEPLEAVAVVPPELLYRFYDSPRSISVKLDRGPGPFDCPLVSLGAADAASDDPLSVPVELRCRIPRDVRAFAGVRLKIAVVTGEARNVLILPITAVAGESDQGYVTLLQDGSRVRRDVRLGLTDGLNIEIREGLAEGDRVLVPPDDPLGLLGEEP
ncbi:MAG: hypothetical protein KatS3mg065_0611 [Chloroflexota bacterium]|nr:MAG: hypothetical protein KatS3mg065_0611 [Chloroflexota bacterium]